MLNLRFTAIQKHPAQNQIFHGPVLFLHPCWELNLGPLRDLPQLYWLWYWDAANTCRSWSSRHVDRHTDGTLRSPACYRTLVGCFSQFTDGFSWLDDRFGFWFLRIWAETSRLKGFLGFLQVLLAHPLHDTPLMTSHKPPHDLTCPNRGNFLHW